MALKDLQNRISASLQRLTKGEAAAGFTPETVVVVSGLPRSGTSMMMKMLEAGGLPVLVDHVREPDEDNPKGYYEFERVKQIEHDQAWLQDAQGRAVKMVSELLKHLPDGYDYKVVFMRRKMGEILASQKRMLARQGKPTDQVSNEKLAQLFEKHLDQIKAWVARQPNVDVLYVSYNEILSAPRQEIRRVNRFLGDALDEEEMVGVIDRSLYRQRK
jgi:hypothetical protein